MIDDLIQQIEPDLLRCQRALLEKGAPPPPFQPYLGGRRAEEIEGGCRVKFGVVVVAGGVGSRLRFEGPKGCYPVSPIRRRTLFQLLCDRVIEASEQLSYPIPVAIMTSPQNHLETVRYFEHNGYCGLSRDQLSFYMQGSLPLLDEKGEPFLETADKIAFGPDGNGGALHALYTSDIWDRWCAQGVEAFNFVPIDNTMADPCDPKLLAFHVQHGSDVTMKCAERRDPDEKTGVVVAVDGRPRVIEYSEISDGARRARDSDGNLLYSVANLSLFCFSMSFARDVVDQEIPLHVAHKAALYLGEDGVTRLSKEPIAWKFERFIFDLLPFAEKVSVLLYPRDEIYAALKSESDLPAVQRALTGRKFCNFMV